MKKLLLSAVFICAAITGANAQTVLSQTGGAATTTNTIFCPSQSGASQASSFYRSYTMTAATKIVSVKVGNIVNLATGTGAPTSYPITVKLYKSNGAFPASAASGLTQIATVDKSLPKSAVTGSGSTATLVPSTADVALTSPVPVAAGDIIVVEVSHATVNGGLFLMGAVASTATGTSGYIKATNCGIATPTDISTINVGTPPAPANGKIVLDLVVDPTASSTEFFTENFTMYPNPVTDVLNIQSKNGLNANEIKISDMTGKVVKVQKDATSVNVSNLSAGTYLIDITTNEGKATSKFIKK